MVGLLTLSVALVLADALLIILTFATVFVGIGIASLLGATTQQVAILALPALGSSLWLVRYFPHQSSGLGPWKAPIFSTCLASLCLAAMFFGHPSTASIAVGNLTIATTQSFVVLILNRLYRKPWIDVEDTAPGSDQHHQQVLNRYAHLPPRIRFWARGKLRFDPLFETLQRFVPSSGHVLDVGCGYALPATWLAVLHPHLRFIAFDVLAKRVRIARYLLEQRALVFQADVNQWEAHCEKDLRFEVVLCIDVLHQLSEPSVVLKRLASRLQPQGVLLLRTTLRSGSEQSAHRVERWMVRLRGQKTEQFHDLEQVTQLLARAGLEAKTLRESKGRTETLFVAGLARTDQWKEPRSNKPLGATARSTEPFSGSED